MSTIISTLERMARECREQADALRERPHTAATLTTLLQLSLEHAALQSAIKCLEKEAP